MNRFTAQKSSGHLLRRSIIAASVFALSAACLLYGTASVRQSAQESTMDSLRLAIIRSSVHCYAVEGRYPEDLDYLKEHYGISWNENRYFVDYEIFGSNLMPSVTVISLDGKGAS
jgi:hypothetical protein